MNHLKVGEMAFAIHHAEGSSHPAHYWLIPVGEVERITIRPNMKVIEWKNTVLFQGASAQKFLEPSKDHFCYFMAALPDMDQYKNGEMYKVPTKTLIEHMKSYKSPWEGL